RLAGVGQRDLEIGAVMARPDLSRPADATIARRTNPFALERVLVDQREVARADGVLLRYVLRFTAVAGFGHTPGRIDGGKAPVGRDGLREPDFNSSGVRRAVQNPFRAVLPDQFDAQRLATLRAAGRGHCQ